MDGDQQAATARDRPMPTERARTKRRPSSRWIVELVGVVVVAILVAVLLRTFVVATYSIPSGSMEPTLKIGDRIVVNKLSYHLHGVDRGNIVVFSTPPNEDCAGPPVSDLVKRVIGLPGEIISLADGQRLHQRAHRSPSRTCRPNVRDDTYPGPSNAPYSLHHAYRIPAGDVFVMGDNRPRVVRQPLLGTDPRVHHRRQGRHADLAAVAGRLLLVPRRSRRQTTRRPDQVSSMAHTLLSTSPSGRATSRTTFSSTVVGQPRGALGPGHPETPVGEDHAAERVDASLELAALGEEGHHDVRLPTGLALDGHLGRQIVDHAGWRTDKRHRRILGDPQLLGQRRPAVPGHQPLTAS